GASPYYAELEKGGATPRQRSQRGSKKLDDTVEGEGVAATGEGGESGGGRCKGSRGAL
ncbi:hypothetical protein A2U01_0092371, partial [Trifolium medium]|nr:hypothetical protein [Trifolium medium]